MDPEIFVPLAHPGEILLADFMEPLQVSQHALALAIGVPATRIHEIVHGRRAISADTGLRLARFFGTSEKFWCGLQWDFDFRNAQRELTGELERIRPLGHPRVEGRPHNVESAAFQMRLEGEAEGQKRQRAKRVRA